MNNIDKMSLELYLKEAELVIEQLSKKFSFGYYDNDDIAQECRIYAMKSYPKYDQEKPAQNFIRVCLTNELHNLFRRVCRRSDAPCKKCSSGNFCGEDSTPCKPFKNWAKTQNFRSALINTSDISEVPENSEAIQQDDTAMGSASKEELRDIIDSNLAANLRSDYLKMLAGITIPTPRKLLVRAAILKIFEEKAPCLAQNLN